MINQYEYYRHPSVRERIAEYCGGSSLNPETFSAEYIVGYGESLLKQGKREFMSANSSDFHWILDNGLDIFRSIWDKRNSVCVLDIEYFNIDYPGEVYFNPERTFNKLEPLYKTIKKIYNEYDIPYLCIMTGQGYHFSSAISNFSKSLKLLEEIGNVCPTLAGKYANPHGKMKRKVSYLHGKSFDGTGRLMEYLTHKIIKETNEISEIPVVFSDIPVGQKKEIGREAISIDLTAFADPLYMRDVRCPFSTHQKHKVQKHKVGDYIASHIPVQISLPRPDNIELKDLIYGRRHFRRSSEISETVNCTIPIADEGFLRLAEEYKNSELKKFHNYFDSTEHDNWQDWPNTYDKTPVSDWPQCIRQIIEQPNPYALKPGYIQTLVRFLISKNWHPKHIAGLLRSKYERNYSWDEDWYKYDAASRANFWVRCFAGFIACGTDSMIDYNCVSQQEKSMCPNINCGQHLG